MQNLRVVPMPGYQDVGGYCVVNANNHSEADCVSLEMARLVAAAPDMLAALREIASSLEAWHNAQDDDDQSHIIGDAEETIRAAISKAMGGTP